MPTYQYVCTNAEDKHEFEVVQSFSDPAVSTCPECGAPVRKVYGSVGVVFKGSGFYRTDSRKAESTSSNGSSSAKEPAASGSKESSSKGSSSSSKDSSAAKSSATSSTSSGASSKAAN